MGRTLALPVAGFSLGLALLAALPAGAELKVYVPRQGVLFSKSPATLIGSGSSGSLEVTLNGRRVEGVKQSGSAFSGPIPLAEGRNVLLVKSGVETVQSIFEHRAGAGDVKAYRYHDPVADGDCKACHPQGVGRTSPVSEAKLCSSCHEPKTGHKYLHGPLGAGQCSICHDPHGSEYPAFLVSSVRGLCVQCHAQNRSKEHIDRAGNRGCSECHDPHGAEKQYLIR